MTITKPAISPTEIASVLRVYDSVSIGSASGRTISRESASLTPVERCAQELQSVGKLSADGPQARASTDVAARVYERFDSISSTNTSASTRSNTSSISFEAHGKIRGKIKKKHLSVTLRAVRSLENIRDLKHKVLAAERAFLKGRGLDIKGQRALEGMMGELERARAGVQLCQGHIPLTKNALIYKSLHKANSVLLTANNMEIDWRARQVVLRQKSVPTLLVPEGSSIKARSASLTLTEREGDNKRYAGLYESSASLPTPRQDSVQTASSLPHLHDDASQPGPSSDLTPKTIRGQAGEATSFVQAERDGVETSPRPHFTAGESNTSLTPPPPPPPPPFPDSDDIVAAAVKRGVAKTSTPRRRADSDDGPPAKMKPSSLGSDHMNGKSENFNKELAERMVTMRRRQDQRAQEEAAQAKSSSSA